MQTELIAVRRAYELGRLRAGAQSALLLSLCAASVALLLGERPWIKLPITFVVWLGVHYWGRALLRGARLGAVAGFVTALLPISWLRPCCAPGAMVTCTMPEMCVVSGAVVGLALAALMPRSGSRLESALGMMLGALSVVWLKCSLLAWGEALGLVGGLLAGIVAVVLAQRPLRA
jgi:hypothetical protein